MSEKESTKGSGSRPTRRDFLRTGAATGIAGLGVGVVARDAVLSAVGGVGDTAVDTVSCGIGSVNSGGDAGQSDGRKHPDNPVLPGSSEDIAQAYPPTVIRVGGKYHAIVKSWPKLVGFQSNDGVHWNEAGEVLAPGSAAWNNGKLTNPLLRYDPAQQTYHLYYSGKGSGGVGVGHATSDRPLSGYTNEDKRPIYTGESLKRELGVPEAEVQMTDLIRIDGEFLFYGAAQYRDRQDFLWLGRGETWTDVNASAVLLDGTADGIDGAMFQTPQILRGESGYLLTYTAGMRGRDIRGEREIYATSGRLHDEFDSGGHRILRTGPCGAWDERRVYAAQWLKRQDGRYVDPVRIDGAIRLYYSGHDLGTSKLTGNLGLTGLAEYQDFPTLASG